jgi:hypothetical protein
MAEAVGRDVGLLRLPDPNLALDIADQQRRSGSGAFAMTGSLLWHIAATFASLSLDSSVAPTRCCRRSIARSSGRGLCFHRAQTVLGDWPAALVGGMSE